MKIKATKSNPTISIESNKSKKVEPKPLSSKPKSNIEVKSPKNQSTTLSNYMEFTQKPTGTNLPKMSLNYKSPKNANKQISIDMKFAQKTMKSMVTSISPMKDIKTNQTPVKITKNKLIKTQVPQMTLSKEPTGIENNSQSLNDYGNNKNEEERSIVYEKDSIKESTIKESTIKESTIKESTIKETQFETIIKSEENFPTNDYIQSLSEINNIHTIDNPELDTKNNLNNKKNLNLHIIDDHALSVDNDMKSGNNEEQLKKSRNELEIFNIEINPDSNNINTESDTLAIPTILLIPPKESMDSNADNDRFKELYLSPRKSDVDDQEDLENDILISVCSKVVNDKQPQVSPLNLQNNENSHPINPVETYSNTLSLKNDNTKKSKNSTSKISFTSDQSKMSPFSPIKNHTTTQLKNDLKMTNNKSREINNNLDRIDSFDKSLLNSISPIQMKPNYNSIKTSNKLQINPKQVGVEGSPLSTKSIKSFINQGNGEVNRSILSNVNHKSTKSVFQGDSKKVVDSKPQQPNRAVISNRRAMYSVNIQKVSPKYKRSVILIQKQWRKYIKAKVLRKQRLIQLKIKMKNTYVQEEKQPELPPIEIPIPIVIIKPKPDPEPEPELVPITIPIPIVVKIPLIDQEIQTLPQPPTFSAEYVNNLEQLLKNKDKDINELKKRLQEMKEELQKPKVVRKDSISLKENALKTIFKYDPNDKNNFCVLGIKSFPRHSYENNNDIKKKVKIMREFVITNSSLNIEVTTNNND